MSESTRTEPTAWIKSSYSDSEGGQCVEIATAPTHVHVRDSKNPTGPHLTFTREAWSAFVARIRD
ncbi:hypothetical protein SRB5_62230 [Streptomyces sp. RB5]|uniref:DUF397 domain-containing protein n=1 Tax=Streptomyces smaragdinus TaxID=2585196 RepID=A0A7K0CRH1_9ACTN|nr:DUF397 domain-containing protein [Streptomyces smaragdinus]MQY16031.1 hypothetical protein [Streptomyces smaragdinus]